MRSKKYPSIKADYESTTVPGLYFGELELNCEKQINNCIGDEFNEDYMKKNADTKPFLLG